MITNLIKPDDMKTKKITLAVIFSLGIVFSGAANSFKSFESFRIQISQDEQITVFTKQEIECIQQDLDTRVIFERHLNEKNTFDIEKFIQPEKELDEPLPMVQ